MEAFKGIIFDSHSAVFRCPQGAITCGETLRLSVFVSAALKPARVTLRLWENEAERLLPMEKQRFFTHTPYGDFLQEFSLNVSCETIGLLWYQFWVDTSEGRLYCGNSEDMLGGPCTVRTEPDYRYSYRINVAAADFSVPEWAQGAIMYQIFPDRFFRAQGAGNCKGKRLHHRWSEAPDYLPDPEKGYYPADDFFGGNLKGIQEKLPYLKSLHVQVLYLNPIFQAYSNHRYDTGDYELVDPLLGTRQDFEELCAAAEEQGIRVILDGVFSHTGSNSRYFNREGQYASVGAYQSQASPYYSWYRFKEFPNQYDCWWGVWSLPCVQEMTPSYSEYILSSPNSIVKRWLKSGASGWRLDVADELPDEFLALLRRCVKEEKSDALILGEVWEDAANKISYGKQREFLFGRCLDSVMNYPLREAIIGFLTHMFNAEEFCRRVLSLRENYPVQTFYSLMNFLSTHDVERITTRLAGDTAALSREEKARYRIDGDALIRAKALHKLAALILYALPGMPCIYYGDEAGMQGCTDPFNRGTYPWGKEDAELLAWYRALGEMRDETFRKGGLQLEAAGPLLSIRREYACAFRYVLINPTDDCIETMLDASYFKDEPKLLLDTGGGTQLTVRENGCYLLLPPFGGAVFGECFT